ncbi:GRAM domain-containing protein 2A-like isoform X1 [Carassius carassius]|uniref:GRAM domain-containing protein 2A-like isoform X1 n=2 Tax=Carassius carassius TaxID=217509 RepID=UPI002868C9DF|nr:GRAM domain-containing protein 2A-like isoform X1 [Carassius carassius]
MHITHGCAAGWRRSVSDRTSKHSMVGSKKANRRLSLDSSGYHPEIMGSAAKSKNSMRRSSDSRGFQNPDETRLEFLEHSGSVSRRSTTLEEEEGLNRPDGSSVRNSFKSHNKTFHKLFPDIPETEDLEHVQSCGLQKEVIYHGKMYLSSHHICFHSSVLLKDTKVMIHMSSVQSLKKKHTAKILPNAIAVITTDRRKYVFVSLLNRDACFRLLQSLCTQLQCQMESSSMKSSSPDLEFDTISSLSSLEETPENPSIHLSDESQALQPEVRGSSTPHDESSRKISSSTAVSWVPMVTGKVRSVLSSNETQGLNTLLLFYVILVILLLLSSGYIGLRIMALEQQLSILGSMQKENLEA